jgi:anthranilate phosphoribosyltransferase
MAKVLQSNGIKRAIVACGTNIDEIAIHANTYIAEVKENGEIEEYTLSPLDLGLTLHPIDAIQGSTPEINKDITLAILNGNGTAAQNCAVAINTGALLYLGKKANTIKEGVQLALEQIQSGNAFKQLEKFQKASNRE